ncbi:DUF6301 family protein [Nocardia lijiangensis]|uniref:DUF6301 family protein n=1 Tax=Nocardia lijiangensis TaxID=299618 RepID=UPI00082D39A0|nr:DUF6301 family protein [Nocardia lijiangensis]
MRIEINKIADKVGVAARFDWAWTDADLEPFCAAAGWQITERGRRGAVLVTDLELARPEAHWVGKDGLGNYMIVFLSDDLDANDTESVRTMYDQFADTSAAIEAVLGPPTQRKAGSDGEVRWDLSKVVIRLRLMDNGIYLRLANPEHQAWLDAPDDEDL